MYRKVMITLFVEDYNPLTPSFYNQVINNLQFHMLTCPCGHSGCLSVHGYYHRYIKSPTGKIRFRICRVKCECCGHTHAILLSSMVPYSQVSTNDHISIINNYLNKHSQDSVMNDNPSIDESCFRYVIRNYLKYWHEKLLSESIRLEPFHQLIRSCFSYFSYQFMQIKNTLNILFLNTT